MAVGTQKTSKLLQLEVESMSHASLESADAVNLLKSTELHGKRNQEVELHKIGQTGHTQQNSDFSEVASSSIANPFYSHTRVFDAKTRDSVMVARRNDTLRRGVESGSKVPKRVTKMYKTGDAHANAPAGVLVSSVTSAMQTLPQNESKPSSKLSPLTELLTKNQSKAVEISKMLVTVNVSGSTGPLRFLVEVRDPVIRVIELALRAYAREGRLPRLGDNCELVELYCANSNFEALDPVQRVGSLGTRRFLLHKKKTEEFEHVAEKTEGVKDISWKFVWNMLNRSIFPN